MTLFRRFAVFARTATLVASAAAVAVPAAAQNYNVSFNACSEPTPPPIFGSPVPLGQIGGGDVAGGGIYSGSPLAVRVNAAAPAPNVLAQFPEFCGATSHVNADDVVVQGPGPQAHVRLHVPFGANIQMDITGLNDGGTPRFDVESTTNQTLFFTASFNGPGFLAFGQFEVQLNRSLDPSASLNRHTPVNAEFVPRPRDPDAPPISGSDGFIKIFFRNVLPVTGGIGVPLAGVNILEIDELRGEIILTADVPTGVPLHLSLDLNIATNSTPFFIAGSSSFADSRFGVPVDGSIVFELPDGYTSQIPSLGVVDNRVPPTFRCQKPMTVWRISAADWPILSQTQTLGRNTYNKLELLDLLNRFAGATRPDASLTLAQQMIAARLNMSFGSDPRPIQPTIDAANALLNGFADRLPLAINPATNTGRQMMQAAIALMNYNNQPLPGCVP